MKKFFLWLSLTVGFFAGIAASDAVVLDTVVIKTPKFTWYFKVDLKKDIGTLKKSIADFTEIPIEKQQVIINEKEWPDETILEDTGLKPSGVVTIRVERSLDEQLHNAIPYDDAALIQQLVDQGANVADGTALTYAVWFGKANAVEALLAAGADTNVKINNDTLLDLAKLKAENTSGSKLGAYKKIISDLRAAGVPEKSRFTQHQKVGLTLAALTAAVGSFIKFRLYQNTKKRLAKKYKLGNLTPLQDKVWLATVLASYRIPWRLRALVRNNEGTLEDFVGSDPRALAELYYGHAPSKTELDAFIERFFADIVGK